MSPFQPDEDLVSLAANTSADNLDPLFLRLGELDPDLPLGAAPFDASVYIEAGKAWWERNRAVIRSYACCNAALQKGAGKAGSNLLNAAFLLLAEHFGSPLATYAVIIFLKEAVGDTLDEAALRSFRGWCGDDWREQELTSTKGIDKL